jgi:hypothetical protein
LPMKYNTIFSRLIVISWEGGFWLQTAMKLTKTPSIYFRNASPSLF